MREVREVIERAPSLPDTPEPPADDLIQYTEAILDTDRSLPGWLSGDDIEKTRAGDIDTSVIYESEVRNIISRSVLMNAVHLQSRMFALFENLRSVYPNQDAVINETIRTSEDTLQASGLVDGLTRNRAVPFEHDARKIRFHERTEYEAARDRSHEKITGGFRTSPDESCGEEFLYWIDLRDASGLSRVEVNIFLLNDYAVEINYMCNEHGVPYHVQSDDMLVFYHNGEPCNADSFLAGHIRNLFREWGLALSDRV